MSKNQQSREEFSNLNNILIGFEYQRETKTISQDLRMCYTTTLTKKHGPRYSSMQNCSQVNNNRDKT